MLKDTSSISIDINQFAADAEPLMTIKASFWALFGLSAQLALGWMVERVDQL